MGIAAGALVLALAAVLVSPALARNEQFGFPGGTPPSGGMSCPAGQSCAAWASGGAEYTSPVTGSITQFTVYHSDEGSGQTATLLVIDDSTGAVQAESAPEPLSNSATSDTFDIAGSPVQITRGQALAVAVTPGGANQSPDNVVAPGSYNGMVAECPTPSIGQSFQTEYNNNQCYAESPSAVVAVAAYVVDAQAPPTIAGYSPPTNVTATSAQLHATVNPNGQDTTVYFAYGTSASNLDQSSSSVDIGNGTANQSVSIAIGGLTPKPGYYYEVVASNYDPSNDSGDTITGSVQSDLSIPAAPAPSVTLAPASGVSEHTVTLNGTVASNGFVTSWHFRYGTDTGYNGGSSAGGSVGSASGATPQTVSDTISGLVANTTYHYQLVASSVGGTVYTQDGTFATTPGKAPTISAYSATPAANGDPTLQTVSFAIDGDGYPTTFHLDYGTTTSYGSSTPEQGSQSAVGSAALDAVSLSGLAPSTTYHYRVVAHNQWGTTTGADQTFTTPAPPVPSLFGFQLGYIDASSFAGDFYVNDRGWAATVYVQYGTTTAYGNTITVYSTLGYATNTLEPFIASGLQPGTVYHWRAVATNRWGTNYGPDETLSTYSLVKLGDLLHLLGSPSPSSAPVIQVPIARPLVQIAVVSCPPACAVSVTFQALLGAGRHRHLASLGQARFRIPATGKRYRLALRLPRRGVQLLTRAHRLRIRARYRIADQHGSTTTLTRTLTLRARARR